MSKLACKRHVLLAERAHQLLLRPVQLGHHQILRALQLRRHPILLALQLRRHQLLLALQVAHGAASLQRGSKFRPRSS